jgi:bifunctional DNase/RNase
MAYEATIQGVGVSVDGDGVGASIVLLQVRDVFIPIFISGTQAREIERERQGQPVERPMTHDLFIDVLEDVDVSIEQVRIDDIEEGTFYAKLDLAVERTTGTEKVVRDARPSDGLALAVRVDCRITVAENVIDVAGRPREMFGNISTNKQFNTSGQRDFELDTGEKESSSQDEGSSGSIDLEDAVEIEFDDADTSEDDDSEQ